MPNLNQNVLINGRILPKGKNISSASVKKFGLGDHLFDKVSKDDSGDSTDSADSGDKED